MSVLRLPCCNRKCAKFILVTIAITLLVAAAYKHYKKTDVSTNFGSVPAKNEFSSQNTIQAVVSNSLPPGVCSTYSELRDVNFLHKSMQHSICKGAAAYSIIDSAFPLCELKQQLPELLTQPVKSGSIESYIRSPVTLRNVSCFVYTSSDLISNAIRTSHIFEEGNVKTMQKLIQTLSAKLPVTFLDIGSNIGVFTLTALDIGVPVVALDANIRNLMRIKLSAESSRVSHKLRLLWNYISSQVSLMYLNFPADCNMGGATKFGRAVTDTIPVMSATADSISSTIGTRTVVMKVDIEGGEAEFFRSARGLFVKFDIPVVHMEWLQRHMTEDERKFMLDFFLSRHYSPRSMFELSRRINIEDPKFDGEDLVWIREDFLKNGSFDV